MYFHGSGGAVMCELTCFLLTIQKCNIIFMSVVMFTCRCVPQTMVNVG